MRKITQKPVDELVQEAFGGKALSALGSEEITAGRAQLEAAVGVLQARISAAEETARNKAFAQVGGGGDLAAALAIVDGGTEPLKKELRQLQFAIELAGQAHAAAVRREHEKVVAEARQALEDTLAQRNDVADRAEKAIAELAECLGQMWRLGQLALAQGKAKLNADVSQGFRSSGGVGLRVSPAHLQRMVNIVLQEKLGAMWEYPYTTLRAIQTFAEDAAQGHGELLAEFSARYEKQMGKGSAVLLSGSPAAVDGAVDGARGVVT